VLALEAPRSPAAHDGVERYIDNGFTTGSGAGDPNWLRDEVQSGNRQVLIRDIPDTDVETIGGTQGLTGPDIDPFACQGIDPRVRILQGRFTDNPGWPEGEFENQNNHSVITRIDFNTASFLFMGDLEEAAIELLVSYYGAITGAILDADVLQVGHHGSHNATTDELLDAVTPRVAVIPVGSGRSGRAAARSRHLRLGTPGRRRSICSRNT
jgi:hypothetical protein